MSAECQQRQDRIRKVVRYLVWVLQVAYTNNHIRPAFEHDWSRSLEYACVEGHRRTLMTSQGTWGLRNVPHSLL